MSDQAEIQSILDSLDPATRTLVAEIDLGNQAKEFFGSELGKFIIGCAQQEISVAQRKLETVAWWRRHRIQQLQNDIWRARNLLSWLGELIASGAAASNSIAERE